MRSIAGLGVTRDTGRTSLTNGAGGRRRQSVVDDMNGSKEDDGHQASDGHRKRGGDKADKTRRLDDGDKEAEDAKMGTENARNKSHGEDAGNEESDEEPQPEKKRKKKRKTKKTLPRVYSPS